MRCPQYRDEPVDIHRECLLWMFYGKLHTRKRRFMKNIQGAGDNGRELIVIANIHLMVRRLWVYPLLHPSAGKIINYVNIKPAFYELRNNMRTNKSSSACNNCPLFFVHNDLTTGTTGLPRNSAEGGWYRGYDSFLHNLLYHEPRALMTIRMVWRMIYKSRSKERRSR